MLSGLRQLQAAFAPQAFDPLTTTARFTLEAGSYACAVLLPEVVARLRRAAPSAELRIRNSGANLVEILDSGRADAAVGGFIRAPERFGRRTLFRDRMVWVMRADHPAAAEPLTMDRLCALPHIIIALAEDASVVDGTLTDGGLQRRVIWDDGAVQRALAAKGVERNVAVAVPDAHSALAIVSRTDMVALAPRRLALAACWEGLTLFDPPNPGESREISLLWRPDHDSAALAWFRGLVEAAAGDLQDDDG
jgi:DNA-binding transcriptional LysR family regulator